MRLLRLCFAIAACCLLAGTVAAQDPPPNQKKLWYKAVSFNGFVSARTGIAQKLKGVTFTPEFKIIKHVIVRGDLRCDFSNKDVFGKRALEVGHQLTALANLMFVY